MENQLVVFELNEESFAVDISWVESIIKLQPIIHLPQAPDFVEGITHLRGKVLPIMDMRKRFDLASRAVNKNNRIIVVNIEGKDIGMIVDGVSEVLTISEMSIEPAPRITSKVDSAYVKGVIKQGERLVILLNLAKILSNKEQQHLEALAN